MSIYNSIIDWLKTYCPDIKIRADGIEFVMDGTRMWLSIDTFTRSAILQAEISTSETDTGIYSGVELANVMTRNMYPYSFVWDNSDRKIIVRKIFIIEIPAGLEFLLNVEICRMHYLCQQVKRGHRTGHSTDFPDDEKWMQSLIPIIDRRAAGDLLKINILYLHGFASSGNSGTAKEIQASLPNCKVISPDLPINPANALKVIHEAVSKNDIALVIGTSMGGLLALFAQARNIISINPSLHVSEMMKQKLGDSTSVTIPYFKAREDGTTEFELTRDIACSYSNLESNAFRQPRLATDKILGIFGTEDDVVNCRDEFQSHVLNIRLFKGGHRLTKESIEEVVVPSILQMIINESINRLLKRPQSFI